MSEEEQADILVTAFQQYAELHGSHPGEAAYDASVLRRNAKECAFICVNTIIKELENHVFNYDMDDHYKDVSPTTTTIPYWHRVKECIATF